VLHAVRLAVRDRNEVGGIDGRYLVELVALNDFDEPQEALLQASEMAVDPDVLGVVGGWSPLSASAAAPEYQSLGLPFLTPVADQAQLGEEAALFATQEFGHAQAVLILGSSAVDRELAQAFRDEFEARGGQIISVLAPGRDGGVSEAIADLAEAFDLLFISAETPTAASWLAQARDAGYTGKIMGGPGLGSSLVPLIAEEAAEGIIHISHFAPASTESGFVEGFQALSGGAPPGPIASWAYNAANRLLDALDRAAGGGKLTRTAVQEVLDQQPADAGSTYLYLIRDGQVFVPVDSMSD
jgi:ABC-type branched-subunit amino acid transport system substrate-binding protein